MKLCKTCGKSLYARNTSGFCAPCRMRHLSTDAEMNAKRQATRLESLAAQSAAERLARFQIVGSPDECWGWTGCHNGVGYPVLRINKQLRVATQVALEADGRPKPSAHHVACHSCDNPICTNPAHLWWGTEKENMQDASRKGRMTGWSRQKGARRDAA